MSGVLGELQHCFLPVLSKFYYGADDKHLAILNIQKRETNQGLHRELKTHNISRCNNLETISNVSTQFVVTLLNHSLILMPT